MTRLRATTSSVIAILATSSCLALLAGAPNAGATDGEAPPSTPPTDPCDVLVDSCAPSFSAVALGDLVRSGRRARLAVVVTSREEDQGTVSHPITAVTITAIHRDGVSRTRTVSPLTARTPGVDARAAPARPVGPDRRRRLRGRFRSGDGEQHRVGPRRAPLTPRRTGGAAFALDPSEC